MPVYRSAATETNLMQLSHVLCLKPLTHFPTTCSIVYHAPYQASAGVFNLWPLFVIVLELCGMTVLLLTSRLPFVVLNL